MFQENKVVGEIVPHKKRSTISFGEALGDDKDIEKLFRSLHDKPENKDPSSPEVQGHHQQKLPPPLTVPPVRSPRETSPHTTQSTNKDSIQDTHRVTYEHKNQIVNRHVNQTVNRVTHHGTGIETEIETDTYPHLRTAIQTGIHTGVHTDTITETQTGLQPATKSNTRTGSYAHIHPDLWLPFTPHQGAVLLYLIEAGGKSNRLHIVEDTCVPFGTVQRTVAILAKHGYITNIERYYNHKERGFTYAINRQKCSEFYERLRNNTGTLKTIRTNISTGIETGAHVGSDGGIQTEHYKAIPTGLHPDQAIPFSSSSREKLTTSAQSSKTEPVILSGPEMMYWREQHLQEKQVLIWCADFDVGPVEMRQQLAWARWDLVVNNKETDVKDPINWFFGVLRKTAGCYPPARGYQTPTEIRAARLREQIATEERARVELATLEAESRFQAVLAEPEGETYQRLIAELPEVMSGMKGKALVSALRERFFAGTGQVETGSHP